MEAIEKTGKSVEEALDAALEEMGLTRDQVDVEILEEPKAGFLGIAAHPAKVRVAHKGATSEQVITVTHSDEEAPESTPEERHAAAERARDLLQQILESMKMDVTTTITVEDEEQVVLDIEGSDVGILIGKHGQTINALQYLIGVMINRKAKTRIRIVLDAEGYRERRAQMLRDLAINMARSVKERGEEAVFEPLPAIERRAIHLALKDDPDVYTYSEGDDPERRVVISPSPAENQ
jgi:spoIIIJ-associated protein